ncbi:MAG: ABC transporter substrate-binding protein [Nitrososphaerota archaeon]|nr:ABC transporter substrate-binding protein [Nitrososphaerota archaeon]
MLRAKRFGHRKGISRTTIIVVIIVVVIIAIAGGYAVLTYLQPAPATPFTWALDFAPVGYMAPVYAASSQGYFKQYGLDATILSNPSGSVSAIEAVATGKAQFGDADFGTLLTLIAKNNVTNVRVVGTFLQNGGGEGIFYNKQLLGCSTTCTPADLNGKTIGESPGSLATLFPVFAQKAGVNVSSLNIVKGSFATMEPGLASGKFAAIVCCFKEHLADPVIQQMGSNVGFFDYGSYGVSVLGVSLITTTTMLQNNPTEVGNIVKAFYKGVQYSFNNPQNAINDMVSMTSGLNATVLLDQWNVMSEYFGTASTITGYSNPTMIGYLDPTTTSNAINIIAGAYGITAPGASTVYTNQFVTQPS